MSLACRRCASRGLGHCCLGDVDGVLRVHNSEEGLLSGCCYALRCYEDGGRDGGRGLGDGRGVEDGDRGISNGLCGSWQIVRTWREKCVVR